MSTTGTLTTTLVNFSQNKQYCKLLNIEDLIYHSSEQYLILCLKICNLIVNYKCNISTLIDINKYKQKSNATIAPPTIVTKKPTLTSILSSIVSSITNETMLQNSTMNMNEPIYSNINYYYINPHFINHHDLLVAKTSISNQTTHGSSNNTMLLPYSQHSSLTIPMLLLNLNETECRKYGYRESHKLSLFILGILLSIFILILNGLTLSTIIRTRRLHTITNILIANLSLSDFLAGCSFLYPCILNLLTINALETYNTHLYEIACNVKQYYYICLVGYSPIITSMLSSIFTLTLLAIEKYIAILKPYLYETLCLYKNKLLPLLLCLNWLISIVISLLPIMGWNEYHQTTIINERQKIIHKSYRGFNCTHPQSMPCMFEKIFTLGYILLFTVICGLCALAMLAIYIRIYIIARKHSKQIALQMTHFNNFSSKTLVQQKQGKKQLDDDDDVDDAAVSMKQLKRAYRSSTHSERSHKNYEKIDNSITTGDSASTQVTTTSTSSTIHQSITLTTYVDILDSKATTPKLRISPSSSSSSISPTQSPVVSSRVIKTTTLSSSMIKTKRTTTTTSETAPSSSTSTYPVSINVKSLNVSMKAMKTLLILLLGFYICWLPLIVYFLTFASRKYNNLTIYILMFVACCNAVIDPIVYAFRNREFYKALLMNFKLKK